MDAFNTPTLWSFLKAYDLEGPSLTILNSEAPSEEDDRALA
jgi:hypothetical protein